MSKSELPSFAQQWVSQWKNAAPRLQAIRDQELRSRGSQQNAAALALLSATALDPAERGSGLIVQQAWFTRARMLELEKRLAQVSRDGSEPAPRA